MTLIASDLSAWLDDMSSVVQRSTEDGEWHILSLLLGWGPDGVQAPAKQADVVAEVGKEFELPWSGKRVPPSFLPGIVQRVRRKRSADLAALRARWVEPDASTETLAATLYRGFFDAGFPIDALPQFLIRLLSSDLAPDSKEYGRKWFRTEDRVSHSSSRNSPDDLVVALVNGVEFPDLVANALDLDLPWRSPARIPNASSHGRVRTFHSAKNDNEFRTESDGEWAVAEILENAHIVLRYASQPVEIPYRDASARSRLHTPDFLVQLRDGRGFLLEVKPLVEMVRREILWKTAGARRYALAKGLGYGQCTLDEGLLTLRDLAQLRVPQVARVAFEELLAGGGALDHSSLSSFRQSHKIRNRHVAALVLQTNACYEFCDPMQAGSTYRITSSRDSLAPSDVVGSLIGKVES